MRNKQRILQSTAITRKPPKQDISDTEFRRKLKNIDEWRKKRLAEIRAKDSH